MKILTTIKNKPVFIDDELYEILQLSNQDGYYIKEIIPMRIGKEIKPKNVKRNNDKQNNDKQ
jgi:hypothetical protein